MKIITNLILLFPILVQAQLYTNASDNLPNSGAKSTAMDVRAADLDGDDDMDIVLANEFQANTILINDGNGGFTNGTFGNLPQLIRDSEDVTIADFNNDGNLDLLFCSEDDVVLGTANVHEFYLGDGMGNFSNAGFQFTDSEANAVTSVDITGDGLEDVFFGNNSGTGVFINLGNGTFESGNDRVPQVSRTTQDLAFADVDGDEDLDLFEGNENGNILHINDGTGNFSDDSTNRLPAGLNIETRKVTFGDVDGDNDLDIFLSNVAFIPGKNQQNRLFLNDGSGIFSDATSTNLPPDNDHTVDAIFEDVDLDGDLDLVVANVFGGTIKIYGNDGEGIFTNMTQSVLGQNYILDALGVIAADFNGDGFRDLYFCDRFQNQTNRKDLLLLRSATSPSKEIFPKKEFLIFPNPVKTHFFVETNFEMPDTIHLFNQEGKVAATLFPKNIGGSIYRFDILNKGLLNGVYILEINGIGKKVFIYK